MAFLSDKDSEKIKNDLKELINDKLLNGFENRKFQPVVSVDSVDVEYDIDTNESDRDNIIVRPVKAVARVWVAGRQPGSKSKNNLDLLINNPVVFSFDDNEKSYVLQDSDKVVMINMTQD
ncbi:hypothetical protein [Flavobacterium lindanitolerans]|uniref:hypothetical protein n=1 Tax=Flavobacterium lindanitolerans TaxID=428988 RepID=UPI0031D63347